MDFNPHYKLIGQHAFLSASKYNWINYDEEKLEQSYLKWQATQKGVRLHSLACELISLGIRLPKNNKTLNMYVNDAIGFKMTPEQPLYYSDNCFGTADTISFKKDQLRIHDLKTGDTPASIHQLEVYDALFCLEYDYHPSEINHELRIYQSDEVIIHEPDPSYIRSIMDKIIIFDQRIEKLKVEGRI